MQLQVDPRGRRRRAQLVDRVVDEDLERDGRTPRGFLRLDQAEIEEVVDDARQALRLLDDPVGQRPGDARVVLRRQRLGQHLERADRCLQLVAHVGDEVAAHALDAVDLGHVGHERGHAERSFGGADRAPPSGGRRRAGDRRAAARARSARRRAPAPRVRRVHRRRPRPSGDRRGTARPQDCGTPRSRRRRARGRPRRARRGPRATGRVARRPSRFRATPCSAPAPVPHSTHRVAGAHGVSRTVR